MKSKRSIKNLISALISQSVVILLGFIVPRLTLTNYGSETNGYMSLVQQIYSYINLLEAGLGTAVVQALYAPVANNDRSVISKIVGAARKYYRKIAVIYAACILLGAAILPFAVTSTLEKTEMFLYFLLFGVSNVINFWFTADMRPLLVAEGKNYITTNITLVFHLGSQTAKIILLNSRISLVMLQAAYTSINILQIVVYYIYFKKNYGWIDQKAKPDMSAIKQRKAFFVQQINSLIFSCTDVILLSVFCDLKVSSVYAMYMLIYNSLSIVLSLFSSSTAFMLGQTYHTGKEQFIPLYRAYDCCLVTVATVCYITAAVLATPFISIYTAGVTDVNYIDYLIPVMLSANGILATCKSASLLTINIAFHAEKTMSRTTVEALINIVISLCLVKTYGIHGVLLGTGVALTYRVVDTTFYTNKAILNERILDSAKLYISNFAMFAAIVLIAKRIRLEINSYLEFFGAAIAVFACCALLFGIINYLLNRKYLKPLMNRFLRKTSN